MKSTEVLVENTLSWCRIATLQHFVNLPCAVVVVYLKVVKVRGNFVEDEYCQKVTESQKTSLRPVISVTCT